jgi:2-keto-4-pentenoate hydratase/2-oxohepta-3-ene-1,7-dioic acid hydratase in catechol pathway
VELNNAVPERPIIFMKSTAALKPMSHQSAPLAFADETFHHEAEVVLLVGSELSLGSKGQWTNVLAVGLGLDLTRRTLQTELKQKGMPWLASKSFAGAAVVTDFVPLGEFPEPKQIAFGLNVNGETKQAGKVADMIFDVPTLLTELARFHRLMPGDLIYTGTPAGVGPIKKGDKFTLAFTDTDHIWNGVL